MSGNKTGNVIAKFLLSSRISLLGMFIIIILLALAWYTVKNFFYNDEATVTSEYISGLLSEQSELTTAEYNYTGMSEFEDTGVRFLNRSDFIMVYHSTARAGIDVKQIDVDVNNRTKTVKLIIPRAEVLDVKVDADSIEYFDEHLALLNWNDKEDSNEAIAQAEREAKEEVSKMGILKMADEQSGALLKGLLQGAVPSDYEFEIEFKEKTEKTEEKDNSSATE